MAYERFWAKVEKSDGCWLWAGALTKGYGQVSIDKRNTYAHRLSWEIHYGPIPKGLFVCHKCDTPRCVRPDHLFVGTCADNIADMWAKGRAKHGALIGSANKAARLKESDIPKIKKLSRDGLGVREIAPLFGVSKSTIHNVVSEKWWRHVT